MNDSWEALVGKSITDLNHNHVFITLEESWLKQLYVQFMLGIEKPVLKLPGVLGKYKTNSEYKIPVVRFIGKSFYYRIKADRINEPGCEWQLRVIRGTN